MDTTLPLHHVFKAFPSNTQIKLCTFISLLHFCGLFKTNLFISDLQSEHPTGVWTDAQGDEHSAEIHWGYQEGNTFNEFTDVASLDSNAATMSLNVIFRNRRKSERLVYKTC